MARDIQLDRTFDDPDQERAHLAAKAVALRIHGINFALTDLREVLHIWRDVTNFYTAEKWAEWDRLLDERMWLQAGKPMDEWVDPRQAGWDRARAEEVAALTNEPAPITEKEVKKMLDNWDWKG